MEKPTEKEYPKWLEEKSGVAIDGSYERYFRSVTKTIREKTEESSYWKSFLGELKNFDATFQINNGGFELDYNTPELCEKSFASFLQKTYRKNFVRWPEPPNGGWILPDNWLERVSDLVRTKITVRYLDGIKYTLEQAEKYFQSVGLRTRQSLEARSEGYYAAHFYFVDSVEIPKKDWDTQVINPWIEIQINTSLKEAISKVTHKAYEVRRLGPGEDNDWKWNHESKDFKMNYLGHILHFIDGTVVEVRKQTITKDIQ